MARPSGELAISQRAQFPAEGGLGDADAKRFPHPLAQIDQAPAHHAVDRRHRSVFDGAHQRRAVRVVQSRRLTRRLAVDQTGGSLSIEFDDPIPHDLQGDAAYGSGLRAGASFVN